MLTVMLLACRFDAGEKPDFLPETKNVREGSWKVHTVSCFDQDAAFTMLLSRPLASSSRRTLGHVAFHQKACMLCLQSVEVLVVQVAPLPKDLQDRRVEITGPVDRKMVINAMNSGASVFMADFEDSNAPTW